MSKHNNILFDWTEPAPLAAGDEEAAVKKVVAEIERLSIPGYTLPPEPPSREQQKDMSKSARVAEKQRQAEHDERVAALDREEKRLRKQEQRLARLADEQDAEQRRQQQKQRDREDRQHEQAASERRRLAALEHEWTHFKTGVARAQREQQREAYFADLQRTLDDLGRMVNPPAPAGPQIVYVEKDDKDARIGIDYPILGR